MDLKPHDRLVGLRDAMKRDGAIAYSEIHMASLQRGYEWDKNNWTSLFEDTKKEIGKEYPINTVNKGPFIGVMILTEISQGPDPAGGQFPYHCELVDGQQRTTTTFLLASILRDHLLVANKGLGTLKSGFDENDRRKVQAEILSGNVTDTIGQIRDFISFGPIGNRSPRLVTWPFLQAVVGATIYTEESHSKGRGLTADHKKANAPTKKYAEAVTGLRKLMNSYIEEVREAVSNNMGQDDDDFEWQLVQAKCAKLMEFWETLVDRMFVVKLTTENIRDAGEVFLSLNSKGKALGTKDIVKATLMNIHASHSGGMQTFGQQWDVMTRQVGNVDQYLRIAWMTLSKKKTAEKNVAVAVAEYLDENPIPNSLKLSDAIFKWAPVYQALMDVSAPQEYRLSEETWVHTQIEALKPMVSYRFFLLPHTLKVRGGAADVGSTVEVIALLRTLSFTWKFVFDLPQKLEDFYFGLGVDLFSDDQDVVKASVVSLREKVAESLEKFKAREMNMVTAKLLWIHVEDSLRRKIHQPTVGWVGNDYTVEHTAPQTSTPGWETKLNPEAKEGFRYGDVVSLVGNLTMLSRAQNSGIQQNPWIDESAPADPRKSKQEAYRNSVFYTTSELSQIQDWDLAMISKRGLWLEFLVKALFDPETGAHSRYVSFPDWLSQN